MDSLKIASAGKSGTTVRSDCRIEIELTGNKGVSIELASKVDTLYGDNIKSQLNELAKFFNLTGTVIRIEDFGALPYTIAARFEAAYKILFPGEKKEFLPEMPEKNKYSTAKDKMRRSRLYLPGNEPKFFVNAGLHRPDGIILDLEDSVAPAEKYAAAFLVRNTLRAVDFYCAERMVRINQLPRGLDDLDFIVPHNIHVILIPKCESPDDVVKVESKVNEIKKKRKVEGNTFFMPIIESAKGVLKAYEIASASENICSLAIGLEDYTADLGTQRTLEGKESFFARSMVVNAARAAGVQPIDTVFSDVSDMEGLTQSVIEAKSLGFEGKGCIHPRQIDPIHKAFAPAAEEIEKAKKIVNAYNEAERRGLGVVALGSKMIDAPVVKRAQRTIRLAVLNGLMKEEEIA